MARKRRQLPSEPVAAHIDSLSHEGRGVAHIDGKAVFIHGALPGEEVNFRYSRQHRKFDEGRVIQVLSASPDRVEASCPHFDLCGGCSLQHMAPSAQIASKQQALLDALGRLGKVVPERVLSPLVNDDVWGYRRKARLGVKYVEKKGKVLVGFREKGSGLLAELSECRVLHPKVGHRLTALAGLIEGLSIRDQVPQIEVSMDDERCVLIFRVLADPSEQDRDRLSRFGEQEDFYIYLQPGGTETIQPLDREIDLHYRLPDFELRLDFLPSDFTQVNSGMNRQMIAHAMGLLDPRPEDRVLDLFCGIGNFTLPLATRVGLVVGVEGDAGLVQRARNNAAQNGLSHVEFHTANLYDDLTHEPWLKQPFNKILLDPPRTGAFEVLEQLPKLGAERIVYVSCYPGTLARDAGELVHRHGYRLLAAGVMDMFPHTAHVESIALFERN